MFEAGLAHNVRSLHIEELDKDCIQDIFSQQEEKLPEGELPAEEILEMNEECKEWIRNRMVSWAGIVRACCNNYANVRTLCIPHFIPTPLMNWPGTELELRTTMSEIAGEEMKFPPHKGCCINSQPIVIATYTKVLTRLRSSLQHLTTLNLEMTFCQLESVMSSKSCSDSATPSLARFLTEVPILQIRFPNPKLVWAEDVKNSSLVRTKDKMSIVLAQAGLRLMSCNPQFSSLKKFVIEHERCGNPIHHLSLTSPDFSDTMLLDENTFFDRSLGRFLRAFRHLQTIDLRILEFNSTTIESFMRENMNTLREITLVACALKDLDGCWSSTFRCMKEMPKLLNCTLTGLNMTSVQYYKQPTGVARTDELFKASPELRHAMHLGDDEDFEILGALHLALRAKTGGYGVATKQEKSDHRPYINLSTDQNRPTLKYHNLPSL